MDAHKKYITDIGDEIPIIKWHPYMAVAICMIGGYGKEQHWWAKNFHSKYLHNRAGGHQGLWRACVSHIMDIGKAISMTRIGLIGQQWPQSKIHKHTN